MAIINVSIGEIIENCPDITVQDTTDYTNPDVFVYSDFKFNDYLLGAPDLNTTFTFDTFVFGPFAFTGVTIEIETDGAGNIINAEAQYLALTSALNAASDPNIQAEFIQPVDTGYRDWYIRISSDDGDTYGGEATSVNTSGGTINPSFTTITGDTVTGATPVEVRNLTILDRDGRAVDLGAISQNDTLELNVATYTEGETFTLDFCGDIVTYTVTSKNTDICVAEGIQAAIDAKTEGLFSDYVDVSRDEATLTLCSSEAGIPLNINVSYSGTETFVYTDSVIPNTPSMAVPSFSDPDEIIYTTKERGGKYTAILTVVSDCDYNVARREFFSWCYDKSEFDCCFVELNKAEGCCSKKKAKVKEASQLGNILDAIDIMVAKGESECDIQSVVDMGWSICQPLMCSCNNNC